MEEPAPLPHVPSNILQATCLYMHTIKVTMEVSGVAARPTHRQSNFHLMVWAVQSQVFGAAALKQINFCHLFLCVVMGSDIANASGMAVRAEVWWGKNCKSPETNCQINCRVKPSSTHTWMMWRKLLRLFANQDKQLTSPLGVWTVPVSELRQSWPHYYLPLTQELAE